MAREKRLRVTSDKLVTILNWPHAEPGTILTVTGADVPADARLVRLYFENGTGLVVFVFESSSFDMVLEGEEIPWLPSGTTQILVRAPRIADRLDRVISRFPELLPRHWGDVIFNPESPKPMTILEYITSPHSSR